MTAVIFSQYVYARIAGSNYSSGVPRKSYTHLP